ncbi:MAG: hypothetical protein Q7R82_01435 [Candidatus Daviesbacteria bacterium]|nr:hypothetical protein [Candidatus Daviesbacteria bacterium]
MNGEGQPGARNRGIVERLRASLRKPKIEALAPGVNAPQQAHDELKQVEGLRDFLAEKASPLVPAWAEREISLDSVNLRALPIDWQALSNLGKAVNVIKNDPLERKDLAAIKPSPNTYPALPMVASVIAHKRNPEIPVVLPTQPEVKIMKPWLNTVERFIGRFSQNWARKFGGYAERRGQQVVVDIGSRISNIAEQVRTIENPRQQFITELTNLYKHLEEPEYRRVETFFGERQEGLKIEDKVNKLLLGLKYVRDGGNHGLYPRDQYPLLTTILPIIKFPPDTLDVGQASVAGAELMEGIEVFLRQQGVREIEPAPKPRQVDFFDMDSWMRGLAEMFAPDRLERVKVGLPNLLTQAYRVLPSSGPKLADQIYDIAENICVLKAQGRSANEIAQKVFVK